MRPMPEIIVSGWFLFGVGLLSVKRSKPERAVMSSKRILPLLSACAAITIVTVRVTMAAMERTMESKNRIIAEAQFNMACLELAAIAPQCRSMLSDARTLLARARPRCFALPQIKLEKAQTERRGSREPT